MINYSNQLRTGFTLVELLVVVGIIAVLMGMTLPAVQSVRVAAARTHCGNNVREVSLGIMNYESSFQTYPIGFRAYSDPKYPGLSFLGAILPYIEENALWERSVSEFQAGVNPFQHVAFQTPVGVYQCPGDFRKGAVQPDLGNTLVALTSYVGIAGVSRNQMNGVLIYAKSVRTGQVIDGLSQTLLLGERPASPDSWCGWWYTGYGQDMTGNPEMIMGMNETNLQNYNAVNCPPGPYRYARGSFEEMSDMFHFWSPHPGGANFAFCDGAVKFIPYDAEPIMTALATKNGREAVSVSF